MNLLAVGCNFEKTTVELRERLAFHEKAIPPMQLNAAVPRTLNDIILKMMAKNPEDRYATAGLAADALEAFLAGKAVVAKIPFRFPKNLDEVRLLPKKAKIVARTERPSWPVVSSGSSDHSEIST